MLRTAAGSALASALVAVALAAEQAKSVVPSGYQRITSVRGIYEYVLPACWNKEGLNAYRAHFPHFMIAISRQGLGRFLEEQGPRACGRAS